MRDLKSSVLYKAVSDRPAADKWAMLMYATRDAGHLGKSKMKVTENLRFRSISNDYESRTAISGLGRRIGQLDAGQTENTEYKGTESDQSPHSCLVAVLREAFMDGWKGVYLQGTETSPPRYARGSPPEDVSYLK
ncbi:hypothetical protein BB560_000695, partial [Smittium megazygosporum]